MWSVIFVQTNREVNMAGYIGQILFSIFMDRDEVENNKKAKNEWGEYLVVLVNKGFIIWPLK